MDGSATPHNNKRTGNAFVALPRFDQQETSNLNSAFHVALLELLTDAGLNTRRGMLYLTFDIQGSCRTELDVCRNHILWI